MAAKNMANGDAGACSFCGRSRQQVDTLIQGPRSTICDLCVRLCAEIVLEHSYITCFYCGTRAYQSSTFHVDAVHGICTTCASAVGKQPDRDQIPPHPGTDPDNADICSFCRKNHQDVGQVIAGPGVNICDECVHACVTLIGEEIGDQCRREGQ